MRIAVAIPCYKVTQHVLGVISAIGPEVEAIYAVDDACPDGSGHYIEEHNRDPRVRVLYTKTALSILVEDNGKGFNPEAPVPAEEAIGREDGVTEAEPLLTGYLAGTPLRLVTRGGDNPFAPRQGARGGP